MIERYSYPQMSRIWSEENKIDKWLQVEIAACEAWAELGIVPREALGKIRQASCDLQRMAEYEKQTDHDVIAFLRAVGETVGEESRHIHVGLTSSDVIDTALSLQIVDGMNLLIAGVDDLARIIGEQAVRYKDTPMIGRTHGVHAEPMTFGFKLAVWVDEMRRHHRRLVEARDQIAVGKISGAVGTHANVPPEVEEYVCRKLGLKPAPVSTQIIQRDRHAHVILILALIASSIEKFATEIRHLQRTEVREVEEPFGATQQGSSAMPHKRNPHKSERMAGLARLVRGYAVTAMENIALWHERDISHSSAERIIFPDAFVLVDYMLRSMGRILAGMQVYPERMQYDLDLTRGLIFSQQVLLALINKGMGRQEAYKVVQRDAMRVWAEGVDFLQLLRDDLAVTSYLSDEELEGLFDVSYHLKYIDTAFDRLELESGATATTNQEEN